MLPMVHTRIAVSLGMWASASLPAPYAVNPIRRGSGSPLPGQNSVSRICSGVMGRHLGRWSAEPGGVTGIKAYLSIAACMTLATTGRRLGLQGDGAAHRCVRIVRR